MMNQHRIEFYMELADGSIAAVTITVKKPEWVVRLVEQELVAELNEVLLRSERVAINQREDALWIRVISVVDRWCQPELSRSAIIAGERFALGENVFLNEVAFAV